MSAVVFDSWVLLQYLLEILFCFLFLLVYIGLCTVGKIQSVVEIVVWILQLEIYISLITSLINDSSWI